VARIADITGTALIIRYHSVFNVFWRYFLYFTGGTSGWRSRNP